MAVRRRRATYTGAMSSVDPECSPEHIPRVGRQPRSRRLAENLEKHGAPRQDAQDTYAAPGESVTPVPPRAPTDAELEFVRGAGIPVSALSEKVERENAIYEAASSAALAEQLNRTTRAVNVIAELLGKTDVDVLRMLTEGHLMAVGTMDQEPRFPNWQFVDGTVLPGLRECLAAFPRDYHALDIERVMTAPAEELGGRSPRQWLAADRPIDPVRKLVAGLSYL